MSEAVVVNEVYKKFGNLSAPRWNRVPRLNRKAAGVIPSVVAVDHVSFTVKQGEIFGILGPGGSGKSTLIRLLATLLLPDGGDIRIFGYDVVYQPMQVQRLVNPVSIEASFFKKLSPLENLVYSARLSGMSNSETRRQALEILNRLGLEQDAIEMPMEAISRGMHQKVAIARAILFQPRLLLLDEPTAGLDPQSMKSVQAVIRELRDQKGTTIFLATRDQAEAENLCDRIALIERGRIVAMKTIRS